MIQNIETDPDLYGVAPVQETLAPASTHANLIPESVVVAEQASSNAMSVINSGSAVVAISRRPSGQLPLEGPYFGQEAPGTAKFLRQRGKQLHT